MKNIIKIMFFACILLMQIVANAQELKYKNVYQALTVQPSEVVFQELLAYQKQDPLHANTYYQLGLIAQKWTKEIDLLQDNDNLQYFLASAIKNFSDAKKMIDEKEARKHREYYANVKPATGDKVQLSDIQADIDNRLKELNDYAIKSKLLNDHFRRAVDCYQQASLAYGSMVNNYPKKKDLLLYANDKLISELKRIDQLFDSTKIHFSIYRSVLDSCPAAKYKQTLSLRPIKNYGMDGFAACNFLDNNILAWDFGAFSKEIVKTANNEVSAARTTYSQIDQSINLNLANALDTTKQLNPVLFSLKNEQLAQIYQFDASSVVCSYLKYRTSVLRLVEMTKARVLCNKEADTWHNLYEKLRFMNEVVAAKKANDSLYINITTSINPNEYNKYKAFFDSKFTKFENVKAALANEQKTAENAVNGILDKCRKRCMNLIISENSNPEVLESREGKLSLKTIVPDFANLTTNVCQTYKMEEDLNGDKYATGYLARAGKKTVAFIARLVKPNGNAATDSLNQGKAWKIAWLKTISLNPNYNECGAEIKLTESHCYLIVNSSVQSGGKMINTLVKFDKQGADLGHTALQDIEVPRSLHIDELNERFVCAFKGKFFEQKITDQAMLNVAAYKFTGDSIWRQKVDITGTVVDLVKAGTDYLVYCNFNKYVDITGSEIITFSGSNTVLVNINESGKRLALKRFMSETPYFAIKALKINNEKIGLMGLRTDFLNIKNPEFRSDASLYFSLSEPDGTEIFNNIK